MTSLELQPFGTVFLLKITIGGSFEPSAVMQKTTVKFDLSWPVVATFAPFRFTVLEPMDTQKVKVQFSPIV
jgi:hypothetical protein